MSAKTLIGSLSMAIAISLLCLPALAQDTDGDGMPDAWEDTYACVDSAVGDSVQDVDGDGLKNLAEYGAGTDPCNPDTDGDGVSDGTEVAQGANALNDAVTPGYMPGPSTRITHDGANSRAPSLAWGTSAFGLSWHDQRSGVYELYFTRVAATGVKIGDDLRLTSDPNNSYNSALVSAGDEFGVSWADNRDGPTQIYFSRVSADGLEIGDDLRVTSLHGNAPTLAWTGSEYGVSWNQAIPYEIQFTRISAAGVLIGGEVRLDTEPVPDSMEPSLAWTGSEFGASWLDSMGAGMPVWNLRLTDMSPGARMLLNRVRASMSAM